MRDYLKEYLYGYHWDPSKAMIRAIEARLISAFDFNAPILDLGCGDGTFAAQLLPKNKVIGVDLRFKNIQKARTQKFYSYLIASDATKLAFRNKAFNSVLINSFLEHIKEPNPEDVLLEANRVLDNKGKIYITLNSKTFGEADPIIVFLKEIKCHKLSQLWHRYRNRRLDLCTLKDCSYWSQLFKRANFRIVESQYYLPFDSEKEFFIWADLQYLGMSCINLGSLIRFFSKIVSGLGINIHRKAIAALFSKILRKDYLSKSQSGSCIFFILEKLGDTIMAN